MYTEDFAETHALLGKFGSTSFNSEQNLAAYVDVSKYNRITVVVHALLVGTSLDVDIEGSAAANGSSPANIKSITQLDGSDDGVVVVIDIQNEEMSNYRYLNVELTPSGTCAAAVQVWGHVARYTPVDKSALAEAVS